MTDTEIQKTIEAMDVFTIGKGKNGSKYVTLNKFKLLALINQSNREYGNWLIGEDDTPAGTVADGYNAVLKMGHSLAAVSSKRVRNQLRAELRKKNVVGFGFHGTYAYIDQKVDELPQNTSVSEAKVNTSEANQTKEGKE